MGKTPGFFLLVTGKIITITLPSDLWLGCVFWLNTHQKANPILGVTVCPRLALKPMSWDSNPAKTHGTWFQDLMKLWFMMSHHRKNSVRDKVIGKKQIYSDSKRSTLHSRVWAMAEGECSPEIWCG